MTTAEVPSPSPVSLPHPPLGRSAPSRVTLVVLFVLLLVSLAARTVFTLWEPVFDGEIRYDDVRRLGDAYWPMNLYVGGPGYAVSWVVTAVFMVLLGRGRSAVVNLIGAHLAGVGGMIFALAITAEVLPFVFADSSALPEVEARALFDAFNAQLPLLVPAILGATTAIGLGVLLVFATALWTGATPRWFAAVGIISLVVLLGAPLERLPHMVTVVSYLLQVTLLAGLGWYGLRSGLRATAAQAR
ncbi:hypothetical protein DFO66_1079 [Brevibacterium sanguinis]|uniref:Uncharacterized protein n=2 Tax=Brevibacterium TaxID=1696 RepID=A0A366IID3_9MICO|nr:MULTISPECIES: hypothetical protein [Brevibacterium]RBP64137.1 hypothetical protein DFO66_1079 [Brevibacterium sanguinis]RBP71571.1 hypothetical protein DFO65_105175 [Brevibacterium celere]